ncbi:MAG: inositol monophosphatase [Caldithrix sp.]|nr:inositol monophosphatase [Caldithrix sp.]
MIETAQKAALAAGEILLQHFRRIPESAIREKQKNDLISFVDEQAEQQIISAIHRDYPQHTILAEESGHKQTDSAYQWIIDPLDGTKNYLAGIPVFAVSIAVQKNHELQAGVIYDPLRNELFRAEKGGGAYVNDQPIGVSATGQLQNSFLATGFPFKAKHLLSDYLKAFEDIFRTAVGMRRMGAAAIDLAYVACGRFDGFWELGLSPWDMAAGALIIREAGGHVSDFWNGEGFMDNSYVIASNQLIHGELSDRLQQHFPQMKTVYQT